MKREPEGRFAISRAGAAQDTGRLETNFSQESDA